jgi:endonuclease/exonuclease/phosphatase family metal-dependent hydrolase
VELTLLSYNIHKGFSARNRAFILPQIRAAIRETGADITFLQEVLGSHSAHQRKYKDWPNEEQFEYLADSVWPHYAYGKNAVYDEGHHGNAVLSKFPIVQHDNFDISGRENEHRGILHCRLRIPDVQGEVDCYCTHLGLFRSTRRQQFQRICEWVNSTSAPQAPLLLGGDFNDWQQQACRLLETQLHVNEAYRKHHGRLARTFPSSFPLLALDRIYCRGFEVISAAVLRGRPWSGLSDHAPVLARLAWES